MVEGRDGGWIGSLSGDLHDEGLHGVGLFESVLLTAMGDGRRGSDELALAIGGGKYIFIGCD